MLLCLKTHECYIKDARMRAPMKEPFRCLFLSSVSLGLIWGLCLVASPFNIPSSRAQQRGDERSGDSVKERASGDSGEERGHVKQTNNVGTKLMRIGILASGALLISPSTGVACGTYCKGLPLPYGFRCARL